MTQDDEYRALRASFSWDEMRAELSGLADGGGLNIAHEAVDRHVAAGRGDHPAIRWLGPDRAETELTYARLSALSNRFANALRSLGVSAGDRVFVLTDRIPELYVVALGTLKIQGVFCALFSAYGPEPVRTRLSLGRGRVLVTTKSLYRRKVAPIRAELPDLEHILIVDADGPPVSPDLTPDGAEGADGAEGLLGYQELVKAASDTFQVRPTDPESPALLHFTSGTTGTPKGVLHAHQAVLGHYATAKTVLDLRPDDVFWCTADPGWVTGVSYGIVAPLTLGATLVVDGTEFDPRRWYETLQRERVSVWYTAPTAIRMLRRYGGALADGYDLSRLRVVASVGEPLSPESVRWGTRTFGRPVRDTWWQTETGSIVIAAPLETEVKPGSMGRPVPGVEVKLVPHESVPEVVDAGPGETTDDSGTARDPDTVGELAIRAGWPSMFRAYLGDKELYAASFRDGWYMSGDLARRDPDGYYWFMGRSDDVIKSAGHLVGPVEIENVLMDHPAVAEVGVIGRPDPLVGEIVKAFVCVRPGHEADDSLRREILGHARTRLGPVVAPKELEFRTQLPKTNSGKILRRTLKETETQ